jgi:hypothetical protein
MPVTLATHAIEQSTAVITASFADENGDLVTPNSGAKWSLTDRDGNFINSREDVLFNPVSATYNIVLGGPDLALPDPQNSLRIVTIEAEYDGTLGNNLPLRDSVRFYIDNLLKVT